MLAKLLDVLFVCVALPVLFFVPGMVLWRHLLVRYKRLRRHAAETLGPLTAAGVQVAASVLVTGWVGFVLGELGLFSRYLLVAIVVGLSAIGLLVGGAGPRALLSARSRKRPAVGAGSLRETVRSAWGRGGLLGRGKGLVNEVLLRNEWFYVPVLLVVAAFLFSSPMRTLWRGHEAGRHLACGIALAERGSFRLDDPIGSMLWPGAKAAAHAEAARLAGDYRVCPRDAKTIYPAFLHFGATWIGIGHALLGRWGALHVTALLAVVGAGMFLAFVREISSVKVAVLATLLLVLNYAQGYFVRTSSPAVVAQFLAFTAFWCFVLFVRLEIKPFGILAGLALGQLVLTGQHVYPHLLVGWFVFACTSFPLYRPRKLYRFIVFPFLLFVFQPALFDTFLGTYYTRTLARGVADALAPGVGAWTARLPEALAKLGGLVGLAVIAVMLYRTAYRRRQRFRETVRGALAWRNGLLLRGVAVAGAVAYLVVFAARHAPSLVEGGVVVQHQKWFYQFLDELGFGFFLLGVGFFVYFRFVTKRQPGLTFPFVVFFLFLLTALWNPLTSGTLMHGAARLVPLYVPFAYFFIAYSLFALREVSGRLVLGAAVKVLVVIVAFVLPAMTAREQRVVRPWERHAPGRNVLGQYDTFLKREPFPRDAIVLFNGTLASSQVPLVMQVLYRIDSVVLDDEASSVQKLGELARRLARSGQPLFLAHEAGAPARMPEGFIRGPELEFEIVTSILEEKVASRPRAIVEAGTKLIFVKLEPHE